MCSIVTVWSTVSDSPAKERTNREPSSEKREGCLETESKWGSKPQPVTKEMVCKCHPELCESSEKDYQETTL